jgi:hypothetical protein
MRFGYGRIGFVRDIREIYNRVNIVEENSWLQCFLWRDMKIKQTPITYRMKAMIFGVSFSPFFAQIMKNYNAKKDED